jgi:hypothetical protein
MEAVAVKSSAGAATHNHCRALSAPRVPAAAHDLCCAVWLLRAGRAMAPTIAAAPLAQCECARRQRRVDSLPERAA